MRKKARTPIRGEARDEIIMKARGGFKGEERESKGVEALECEANSLRNTHEW